MVAEKPAAQPSNIIDLMDALSASLKAREDADAQGGSGKEAEGKGEEKAADKPTRRRTPKKSA